MAETALVTANEALEKTATGPTCRSRRSGAEGYAGSLADVEPKEFAKAVWRLLAAEGKYDRGEITRGINKTATKAQLAALKSRRRAEARR